MVLIRESTIEASRPNEEQRGEDLFKECKLFTIKDIRERSKKGHLIILARAINRILSTMIANIGAITRYILIVAIKRAG